MIIHSLLLLYSLHILPTQVYLSISASHLFFIMSATNINSVLSKRNYEEAANAPAAVNNRMDLAVLSLDFVYGSLC